jgi:hypothetical protein
LDRLLTTCDSGKISDTYAWRVHIRSTLASECPQQHIPTDFLHFACIYK